MTIDDCKRVLKELGFTVATGDMVLTIGDNHEHEIKTPIVAVKVSTSHRCHDSECHSFHLIGTSHALAHMSEGALRAMISDELWGNR